jgi:hypothetical protein
VICDNCKNEFDTYPCYSKRNRKHRFCCKKCESEYRSYKNTFEHWKGGQIAKSTGYKYITINGKAIEEHRLVMMKHLGRKLKANECVHHINGDKLDNRIENLMLLTNVEHAKLHSISRSRICICVECGETKEHHGRGLCHTCYHRVLMKGELSRYENSKKQVPQQNCNC